METPEIVKQKAEELAEMIQKSKYFIAFTGAGISTSTGIPDYRSAHGTILKTGPGAYERPAEVMRTEVHVHRMKTQQAVPSLTHMAMFAMQEKGLLKHVVR